MRGSRAICCSRHLYVPNTPKRARNGWTHKKKPTDRVDVNTHALGTEESSKLRTLAILTPTLLEKQGRHANPHFIKRETEEQRMRQPQANAPESHRGRRENALSRPRGKSSPLYIKRCRNSLAPFPAFVFCCLTQKLRNEVCYYVELL